MRKMMLLVIALCLLLTALSPMALATDVEETTEVTQAPTEVTRAPDECGENLKWDFAEGVLTVTGDGEMDDFTDGAPWAEHKADIKKVVLSGWVTYIGANAFTDYDAITEVDFGSGLKEIGKEAFKFCDGLTSVSLPVSFKIFGEESFRGCSNLKEIHCAGGFPSFRLNCLWEAYVTIYFPVGGPWPVSLIEELENAFHGRIEFRAADGSDPYVPTEATEATTEALTEAPTEAPVETPTEVPTEAPTEPETEPVVPPVQTEPAAEENDPAAEKGAGLLGSVIKGVLLFVLILTGLLVLVLILRGRKKGKYSR